MPLKKGLGKGLDAIIGSRKSDKRESSFVNNTIENDFPHQFLKEISIDIISTNPHQARKSFDQAAMEELAESIKFSGILQPIAVAKQKAGKYILVAGERRLRASKMAGLKKIPVRIVESQGEKSLAVLGLVENLQREDLDPLEEAEAFAILTDKFSLTQQQIAQAVSKSRPYVANSIRLLDLPEQVLELIRQGKLTAGHGRAILRLSDVGQRIALAVKIVAQKLSVREAESLAEKQATQTNGSRRQPAVTKHPYNWIAEDLKGQLGTKVEFQGKSSKGRIVIHYFSEEDLTRIVELLKS